MYRLSHTIYDKYFIKQFIGGKNYGYGKYQNI